MSTIKDQNLPSQRIRIYIFGDRDTSITKLPTDAIARLNTIINLGQKSTSVMPEVQTD